MNISTLTKTTAEKENITESDIEQIIINNISNLQLGDIDVIKSQYNQYYGILDILALDSINNIYYEIELMLGEIDSRHIGHILDYWVKEKSERLYSSHIAVIIGESVRGRYQRLLSELSNYIPIICSEFTLFKNNDSIFFNCEHIYYPNTISFKTFKKENKSINMVTKQSYQFMVKILENPLILKSNRRELSKYTEVSLGSTCKFIKNLQDMKHLDDELNIIDKERLIEYVTHVKYFINPNKND